MASQGWVDDEEAVSDWEVAIRLLGAGGAELTVVVSARTLSSEEIALEAI